MPFRFQSTVAYEQLRLFVKDIFTFTGTLPSYETNGLIMQIRGLSTSLIQEYAAAFAQTPPQNAPLAMEHCIATVAKIAALIDLCAQLGYTGTGQRQRWLLTCEELTRRLHETKKSLK